MVALLDDDEGAGGDAMPTTAWSMKFLPNLGRRYRGGPNRLNTEISFISGATLRVHYAFSYAASLTAGSIAA